jgi:hypothetical protein
VGQQRGQARVVGLLERIGKRLETDPGQQEAVVFDLPEILPLGIGKRGTGGGGLGEGRRSTYWTIGSFSNGLVFSGRRRAPAHPPDDADRSEEQYADHEQGRQPDE